MAKAKDKSIYTARSSYVDLNKRENSFPELVVKIEVIETAFILLHSPEETVLITVFNHLAKIAKKRRENVEEMRNKNLLGLLKDKEFFLDNGNEVVRRFALYMTTLIIEIMNTLQDFETSEVFEIMDICIRFYLSTNDIFCLEYLTVIINKCLDDPQVAREILRNPDFLVKFFPVLGKTDDPDTLLNSLEALHKMLQVNADEEEMGAFVADPLLPIDRIICELTNEYEKIRFAALRVLKMFIQDTSDMSPFSDISRCVFALTQMTTTLLEDPTNELAAEVMDVLATAMRIDYMAQLYIEHNLFDKVVQDLEAKMFQYSMETKCRLLTIVAEIAKYSQYLYRIHMAHLTDLFLWCLMDHDTHPAMHIPLGLNRLMKFPDAGNRIVAEYDMGLLPRLMYLISEPKVHIKTREQVAELLNNLITFAFHRTAGELMTIKMPNILGTTFAQGLPNLSIDLILTLLSVIENLAQNVEYRCQLAKSSVLIMNMAVLLKNTFNAAVLTCTIFRCLTTLVEETKTRDVLMQYYIGPSVRRGLKSLANTVKMAVTNFIMQTTRFPEFANDYIDNGALEILILRQKHAFCVSTWTPAIDSILAKTPTLKFCIRNHLGFMDSTVGHDFLISKKKFDDFRIFQCIISSEVSPIHPILVVNFERRESPADMVVHVPLMCFRPEDGVGEGNVWCYCRRPGDPNLPLYLEQLNHELLNQGLLENPCKIKRCIDFDNVAKRAKVVALLVASILSEDLKPLDLNAPEECSHHTVCCHLRSLTMSLHCNFIPIGMIRSGCQFERAILFKALADQIGLPATLQRSVDGKILFNEVPLPVEIDHDIHCDVNMMKLMPWRMLRPTHIVDLMFNVGDLYPIQSRQALQYLRLY